jgi:hypothetical protein
MYTNRHCLPVEPLHGTDSWDPHGPVEQPSQHPSRTVDSERTAEGGHHPGSATLEHQTPEGPNEDSTLPYDHFHEEWDHGAEARREKKKKKRRRQT